jgi:hypothetical protein
MKALLVILASSLFLISSVNITSAESWVFKKPSADYTDSKLLSERKSVNLIKFTTSEDTIKKDSIPNEVSRPYMYLKLQWDTEKPVTFMQLGKHYEENENGHMLQFFLLLYIVIP